MTTSNTANTAFKSKLKKLLLRPFPALYLAAPLLMLAAALVLSAAPFSPAVTAPAGEAGAQSPDGPPRGDGQGAPGTGDGIDAAIKARTLEEVAVPPGTVAALGLRLSDVQGSHPALKRGDAVLKGHARSVEYEGRLIGQIVVASVAIGEAEVAIQADPLAAQFDLEEAVIGRGREVVLKGDLAALIAALEELAAAAEGEQAPVQRIEIEGPGQTPSASGGNGGGNDVAASYRTPERYEAQREPEVSVRVTTEGCDVRVDLAQLVAIQQSRSVTYEDGAPGQESACSDSTVRYPLQKDYSSCPAAVDVAARTARPQFRWYYTASGAEGSEAGAREIVGECEPDEDGELTMTEDHARCRVEIDTAGGRAVPHAALVYEDRNGRTEVARECAPSASRGPYDLVEDHARCQVDTDFENGQAVPRAALVYTDYEGRTVEARGCEASRSRQAARMVLSDEGCDIVHDFANERSERFAAWRYTLDGVVYQASACAGTEEHYAHERVYTDGGSFVCPRTAERGTGGVILQSRVRITVGGEGRYIRECVPDTDGTAVEPTTEGCADPSLWTHDLAAGVSYGQERFYFMHEGAREYVTECVDSDQTYTHDVTTVDYEHDDPGRYSHPVSRVVIDPPSGEYEIAERTVLPGAAQVPYEWLRDDVVEVGSRSLSGCRETWATERIECYRRPSPVAPLPASTSGECSDTEHRHALGPGVPGSREACTVISEFLEPTGIVTQTGCQEVETRRWVQTWSRPGYTEKRDGGAGSPIVRSEICTLASTSDVGTGTFTYQDCAKMESTVRTETWSRPGYSEQRQKGPGVPIDRGNACTLTSTVDVRTGTFSYNDCDKYEETETTEYHTREDGAQIVTVAGAGTPISLGDACTVQISSTWSRVSGSPVMHNYVGECCRTCRITPGTMGCCGEWRYHSSTYRGSRSLVRDDGVTVSTDNGTGVWDRSSKMCSWSKDMDDPHPNKAPSSTSNNSLINAWAVALGWK